MWSLKEGEKMKLQIFGISDKGCVREHNEDMVIIGESIFRDDTKEIAVELDENNNIFFVAIADGMGGHNKGEVASELVLTKMSEKIKTLSSGLEEAELKIKITEWAKEIHEYIETEGNKDISYKGMGTTLIGVIFYNNKVYYINAGDSRLYRYRRGYLTKISRDHSLREVTGNENIDSHILLNSFGGGKKVEIDFEPVGGKIVNDDNFLLCSDGLTDMLNDDEIEEIIGKENAVFNLVEQAKQKGGKDNISIVLLNISVQQKEKKLLFNDFSFVGKDKNEANIDYATDAQREVVFKTESYGKCQI